MKFRKDKRKVSWANLEKDIQERSKSKDPSFILTGEWKRFIGVQEGYKIYQVDGTWVRNNLSIIFGHGGHGLVHEFIPLHEIWIAEKHFNGCKCGGGKLSGTKLTQAYFKSCIAHEIKECKEMKKGRPYWEAHQIAQNLERELRLIPDDQIYDE